MPLFDPKTILRMVDSQLENLDKEAEDSLVRIWHKVSELVEKAKGE